MEKCPRCKQPTRARELKICDGICAGCAGAEDGLRAAARRLQRAGFFAWGHDAWIHQDDEGTVLSTQAALTKADGGRA